MKDHELLAHLRSEGPLSPAILMNQLQISQPTLFRRVKSLSEQVIALGGGRNRKLAALRNIVGAGNSFPLFTVSVRAEVKLLGQLHAIYPRSFVFLSEGKPNQPEFYPGIPFFLDDVRPQGFLGRGFSQRYAELRLPPRTQDWTQDDTILALVNHGEDLIGNIFLGAQSFEHYQKQLHAEVKPISAHTPETEYLSQAQAALESGTGGSSAGGENPKFGAVLSYKDHTIKKALVKFSPKGRSFASQRWHDLLVCESLALNLLRDHGIASAETRIIETSERTFLETIRFDRVGRHGRKGVLSLGALENEWVGHGENWAASAALLAKENKISHEDLSMIQRLECFGRLIANSDRHPGNLSFFWEPGEKMAQLAPVYDMLPMLYAPSSQGEDTQREFQMPSYDHTLLAAWNPARRLATQYWQRVREDRRISADFQKIAEKNLKILQN